MKIVLDIPKELIEEAMNVSGARSKSQLFKDALREQINRSKRKKIIAFKGNIDLDIDLNTLRKRLDTL